MRSDHLCPDFMETRENQLRNMDDLAVCRTAADRALQLYGSPIPTPIANRLKKEQHCIQSSHTGHRMRIAAQLSSKSRREGGYVLFRGTIASSLTAMLCGITEINPLPPHHRCPECCMTDFSVVMTKYRCGPDLPDRLCPRCGVKMEKDGYHIFHQTYFGLRGEKNSSIDLLFSSGELDKVRANDVIRGQDDHSNIHCFKNPVLNLLPLLQKHSGIDPFQVPLNDEDAIGLFRHSDPCLKSSPVTQIGVLGIPGFVSPEAGNILKTVRPVIVGEVIKVVGWLRGTDVWSEDYRDCIRRETTGALEYPASRDDVMLDLLNCGFSEEEAYQVMEEVRTGKLHRFPKHVDLMRERHIPEWYINGCLKTRYMYPRAHCVGNAILALRAAWYKAHQPEAFYSSWFELLGKEMLDSDYQQDCVTLDHVIMPEMKKSLGTDNSPFPEISRLHGLLLLLEKKRRGVVISKSNSQVPESAN